MIRLIMAAITLSFYVATSAQALTLAQARELSSSLEQKVDGKLASSLDKASSELNRTHINLLEMAQGMQKSEMLTMDYIYEIANQIRNAEDAFDKLSIYYSLSSLMIYKVDQMRIQHFIPVQIKRTLREADFAIATINRYLGVLRSPAVIAEAQKARELIQKMHEEIQRTVPSR